MTPDARFETEPDKALPTVALLGEFSAGKSTLANVLLGTNCSPVRVTATQAPPIWYVHGSGLPVQIARDGTETTLRGGSLSDLSLEETRAVRVPLDAGILRHFTLLDMPGSSDPNMSPDIWDTLLPLADFVIWCTPATQAWRQSEAAAWETVPEKLHARSLLLVTRMDKVSTETDRARVIGRVKRETHGLFRAVLPVSLLQVKGVPSRCEASGMASIMSELTGSLSGASLAEDPAETEKTPEPNELSPTASGADERLAAGKPTPSIVPRRVAAPVESSGDRRILHRIAQDEGRA